MKKLFVLFLASIILTSPLIGMENHNSNKRPHEQEEHGPNKHQKTDSASSTDNNNTPQENPAAIIVTNDDQKTELTSQELEIIKLSKTIINMLDDCMEIDPQDTCPELYFPNLTKEDFMLIATLLSHVYCKNFVDLHKAIHQLSIENLFHIIGLANYLDVPLLLNYCIKTCAQKLIEQENIQKLITSNPIFMQLLHNQPSEIIILLIKKVQKILRADACVAGTLRTIFKNSSCFNNSKQIYFGPSNRLCIIDTEGIPSIYDYSDPHALELIKKISFFKEVLDEDDQLIMNVTFNENLLALTNVDDNFSYIDNYLDPENKDLETINGNVHKFNGKLLTCVDWDNKATSLYDCTDPNNLKLLTTVKGMDPEFNAENTLFVTSSADNDEKYETYLYDCSDPHNILPKATLKGDTLRKKSPIFDIKDSILITYSDEDDCLYIYNCKDVDNIILAKEMPDCASFAVNHKKQLLAKKVKGQYIVELYDYADPNNITRLTSLNCKGDNFNFTPDGCFFITHTQDPHPSSLNAPSLLPNPMITKSALYDCSDPQEIIFLTTFNGTLKQLQNNRFLCYEKNIHNFFDSKPFFGHTLDKYQFSPDNTLFAYFTHLETENPCLHLANLKPYQAWSSWVLENVYLDQLLLMFALFHYPENIKKEIATNDQLQKLSINLYQSMNQDTRNFFNRAVILPELALLLEVDSWFE